MSPVRNFQTAVEAMKAGAFDYVQKPFEIEEMEVKIQRALDLRRMQHEIDYLRRKLDPHTDEPLIQTKRGFGYMLKAAKG